MNPVLLGAIAGGAFSVASLLGLAGRQPGPGVRSFSISVAAGILFAISIAELFPEAIEVAGHEKAAIAFLIGFSIPYAIEVLTKGHVHHHREEGHIEGDHHDPVHGHVHAHALWPFVIGLALHNLTDGFAIGTSHQLSREAASAVTGGVLVHQLPVGLSFAAVLLASRASRRFLAKAAIFLGLVIPLGALTIALLPDLGDRHIAILAAAAAGALAYIAAGHLLPEAHAERVSPIGAATFPATLAITAYVFLSVVHGG